MSAPEFHWRLTKSLYWLSGVWSEFKVDMCIPINCQPIQAISLMNFAANKHKYPSAICVCIQLRLIHTIATWPNVREIERQTDFMRKSRWDRKLFNGQAVNDAVKCRIFRIRIVYDANRSFVRRVVWCAVITSFRVKAIFECMTNGTVLTEPMVVAAMSDEWSSDISLEERRKKSVFYAAVFTEFINKSKIDKCVRAAE